MVLQASEKCSRSIKVSLICSIHIGVLHRSYWISVLRTVLIYFSLDSDNVLSHVKSLKCRMSILFILLIFLFYFEEILSENSIRWYEFYWTEHHSSEKWILLPIPSYISLAKFLIGYWEIKHQSLLFSHSVIPILWNSTDINLPGLSSTACFQQMEFLRHRWKWKQTALAIWLISVGGGEPTNLWQ